MLLAVILLTDCHFKIEGLEFISCNDILEVISSSHEHTPTESHSRAFTVSTLAEGAINTTVRVCTVGLSTNRLIWPIYVNTQWIASTCRGRSVKGHNGQCLNALFDLVYA